MEHLIFEQTDGIGVLRIHRPEALNALNAKLLSELQEFLSKKLDVGVLIVTGSGDNSFVAGADIREMARMGALEVEKLTALGQKVSLMLETAPYIAIAAVNGFALGGGLELALACDFIYASNTAILGLPEVSLGVVPGFGGMQRLARTVGQRTAKELIFTGRKIGAEEAFKIGLVNRISEPSTLMKDCMTTGRMILKNSMSSVLAAKRVMAQSYHLPIGEALQLERGAFVHAFSTPDRKEGMAAFLEKRTPHFEGVASVC